MNTNDWTTQEQDMQVADTIIAKHVDFNDGEPIAMLHVTVNRGDTAKAVEIQIQDWVIELLEHFREQYGWKQGSTVAGKVLTRLLLKGETVH